MYRKKKYEINILTAASITESFFWGCDAMWLGKEY